MDTQHKNIYDTKNSPKPHERDNKDIRKQAGENSNQTIKNIITNVKSAMDEKKLQHMEKVEKGYIDTQNKRFLDKPVDKDYKSRPNNRQ